MRGLRGASLPSQVRGLVASLLFGALLMANGVARAASVSGPSKIVLASQQMLDARDYLGFRCLVKALRLKKLGDADWSAIRAQIANQQDELGYDLLRSWDAMPKAGHIARTSGTNWASAMDQGDQLMLAGRYNDGFTLFQKVARAAQRHSEAKAFLPYVYHAMGRALFGAKRNREALEVYSWIPTSYPAFRQVLFEKMWTAFRDGQIDVALGAIASQRSSYFARYMQPESYLLQAYIYRKLCRNDELKGVLSEMAHYEQSLARGEIEAWSGQDLETASLWRLSHSPLAGEAGKLISLASRQRERGLIYQGLKQEFARQRPLLSKDLRIAKTYVQMARFADSAVSFRPVKRFESREALLKEGLEIWPAGSSEEWADEIGTHRYMGESLCQARAQSQ